MDQNWPVLLFSKSILKQRKFKEITDLLGETDKLHCLDIGSDNGVISYLLREKGGKWKSVDLEDKAIQSIREVVKYDVFQIDGRRTIFKDNEFDRVVIIDFLEHIQTDKEFITELFRIIKPNGELIINVPHTKNSLLRKFRIAIGQTDEKHGHVRQGYTVESLMKLMEGRFSLISYKTYSKFFSECIDTLVAFTFDLLKKGETKSKKGLIVTEQDLSRYQKLFRAYSIIYPVVWFFAKLDVLLFWCSGYMMIFKTRVNKKQTSVKNLQAMPIRIGEMK